MRTKVRFYTKCDFIRNFSSDQADLSEQNKEENGEEFFMNEKEEKERAENDNENDNENGNDGSKGNDSTDTPDRLSIDENLCHNKKQ